MPKWTDKQQQVIDTRDCSILVSASAGSGKTAVLVERILQQVLDEDPTKRCNIDDFLIVTFTNAAAAQMRQKITERLEKALEEKPEDEHILKQLVLVNHADISTIDSFCMHLVKEHFSLLKLDSVFNIGDEGMLTLVRMEVIDRLFEVKYKQENNETFLSLIDLFGKDYDDEGLKKAVLRIAKISNSFPQPETWIDNAKSALCVDNAEDFEKLEFIQRCCEMFKNTLHEVRSLVLENEKLVENEDGYEKVILTAKKDIEKIDGILATNSYHEIHARVSEKWATIGRLSKDTDDTLYNVFKSKREAYKKLYEKSNVFKTSVENILEEYKQLREYLLPLLELTEEYMALYAKEKEKRKLMEFNDVEHLAYQLVCAGYDTEDPTNRFRQAIPTPVGKQISERYREIYIDEYQDSNFLQEDILCSISGMHRGDYNMFMVGDVKQSIYRFRMARPDLFIHKTKRFASKGNETLIELSNNFRSRDVVLLPVNYFFYQLMGEDLGGIIYNQDAALVPSKAFPDYDQDKISHTTDIIMIDSELEADDASEDVGVVSNQQLEANMIANKIVELVDSDHPLYIFDEEGETPGYRKATYKDVLILVRSMKAYGEPLRNALTAKGIPVYLEDSKGYFNAVEIQIVMSFLAVIDNARQDIPLSSVLLSPIGGLSESEIAIICNYAEKKLRTKALYERCQCYMLDNEETELGQKLIRFFDIVEELKSDRSKMSIRALIWKALSITGYYDYAYAMPMGEKRRENLNLLLEKAKQFEDGQFKGLFHFLRYIEKLKLGEADFGEASTLGGEENLVQVMSMHKSKGLEKPIVFVSGMGSNINFKDGHGDLVIHSDYYLSASLFDQMDRFKKGSFLKDALKEMLEMETLAEELRIFYVALTRAKEKLIITGVGKAVEQSFMMGDTVNLNEILLPYGTRRAAKNYSDWIFAAMKRYPVLAKQYGVENMITVTVVPQAEILIDMGVKANEKRMSLEQIRNSAENGEPGEFYETYVERFKDEYPYKMLTDLPSKRSISDIKKMKAFDGEGYDWNDSSQRDKIFGKKQEVADEDVSSEKEDMEDKEESSEVRIYSGDPRLDGATRGTLVHKFMELLDFKSVDPDTLNQDYIKEQKRAMLDKGFFEDWQLDAINEFKVCKMITSDLGRRMIAADARGDLIKEQSFSMGVPVKEIFEKNLEGVDNVEDVIIVQGIIDAFFYEDGQVVLMDYKTDVGDDEFLRNCYKAQLEEYARAIENITDCKVKEKMMYSFYQNKEVNC